MARTSQMTQVGKHKMEISNLDKVLWPHDGIVKVECVSLEALHKQYSLKGIGLISMDVEGSELTVLENDINFLKKQRPILQVSMYHRTTDLVDLFMILKNGLDNYAYFLGHHKAKHTETDLYCMPRELMK